ncbi:winged helix DNA-binding domain-containing protein [Aldersonia sp. NBC_00410]|uniref:winged helix DNA-binding domain-containing protein n=1 Tax=Aldersonia sp. NBC_00410 TaxID=2975954 RepID=UPI00224F902C|nr:winged helix DNA-binding domain-containing protein [Aldersonia sp. NBC_00410]MCX5044782.1 winged helix DNA-binding domain-containing protein [Aldersonia sp. NBC_00410]
MEFSTAHRRARLVARHHLGGTASGPVEAASGVVVLHATEPASVYLSVLARCASAALADVGHALHEERSLVRMLAMRRTLFVVPAATVPVIHHAAALDIAAQQRTRLLTQLRTVPTDPELPDDLETWLTSVEASVERAILARGAASAAQLSNDEPRLRTALLPTTDKKWDIKRNITTQVLVTLGARSLLVRAEPRGGWTSRAHTWEPGMRWWPDGIPPVVDAKARLVQLYLRRFGPATETDIAWWTGWALGTTRKALAALDTVDVGCGLVLADDTVPDEPGKPTATLLPALDPTAMGWKQRDWYLPENWQPLFDRNGNIGPTIWWGGEIIGAWSVRSDGSIVTGLLADRGKAAARAVDRAAALLHPRLEGAAVVPSFPTPLEKELRTSGQRPRSR